MFRQQQQGLKDLQPETLPLASQGAQRVEAEPRTDLHCQGCDVFCVETQRISQSLSLSLSTSWPFALQRKHRLDREAARARVPEAARRCLAASAPFFHRLRALRRAVALRFSVRLSSADRVCARFRRAFNQLTKTRCFRRRTLKASAAFLCCATRSLRARACRRLSASSAQLAKTCSFLCLKDCASAAAAVISTASCL